jgi:hypothetical protein
MYKVINRSTILSDLYRGPKSSHDASEQREIDALLISLVRNHSRGRVKQGAKKKPGNENTGAVKLEGVERGGAYARPAVIMQAACVER